MSERLKDQHCYPYLKYNHPYIERVFKEQYGIILSRREIDDINLLFTLSKTRHNKEDGAIATSTALLKKLNKNPSVTRKTWKEYGLVDDTGYWHCKGSCRPGFLTEYWKDLNKEVYRLKKQDGYTKEGIFVKRGKRYSKINELPIEDEREGEVDVQALHNHLKYLKHQLHIVAASEKNKVRQSIYDCEKMISYAEDNDGKVKQQHVRNPHGRLFDINALQTIKKDVRNVAYNGYYDYDFKNCHFTIIHNLFPDLETIAEVCKDPDQWKEDMAQQLGMTDKEGRKAIKKCLQSLLYGASIKSKKGVLEHELGDKKQKFIEINKNLINDIKQIRERVEKKGPFRYHGKDFYTLCTLLQTIEGYMLDSIKDDAGAVALFFDGFIAPKNDADRLEQMVYDRTGIKVQITEQKL